MPTMALLIFLFYKIPKFARYPDLYKPATVLYILSYSKENMNLLLNHTVSIYVSGVVVPSLQKNALLGLALAKVECEKGTRVAKGSRKKRGFF